MSTENVTLQTIHYHNGGNDWEPRWDGIHNSEGEFLSSGYRTRKYYQRELMSNGVE